jgi:hypothetical protein
MKLAILAAALLLPASAPAPQAPPAQAEQPERHRTPNAHGDRPGCTPIVQQVAGENRKYRGTRLDQQPPAQLLLAVDRQVGGCREVTFLRRNIAPGGSMPQVDGDRK